MGGVAQRCGGPDVLGLEVVGAPRMGARRVGGEPRRVGGSFEKVEALQGGGFEG